MTLVPPDRWQPQGIDDLEPRAWEALRETDRSVCVTAGAGAGKTEFLAQKATYLLQTGLCPDPKRILAISFKKDAAQNLGARVEKRCLPNQSRRFHSMTFDAFTKHLIDQFRLAVPAPYAPPADYRIAFPNRDAFADFLNRAQAQDVDPQDFEQVIARTAVPLGQAELSERARSLLRAYWSEQYNGYDDVLLSFPMINRIVHYLLRTNPYIRKALHATYSFVFLDEFQDTTYAQFDLVQTAFEGSPAKFTAVGDDKQRIMGWAGAMANAFEEFTVRYNAVNKSLLSNWRSHEALVDIQHVIASRIDPTVERVQARADRSVAGDIAAIWAFDSRQEEAGWIAAWIGAEVAAGHVEPHDVAILVRKSANNVEAELAPSLAARGLILRNVARKVGSIAIQDLLSEELSAVLLPLLRLGAANRNPQAWTGAQEYLRAIYAIHEDDDRGLQRLQHNLETFSRGLRLYMRTHAPDEASAVNVARQALDFVGSATMRQAFLSYQRDADFERVWEGFRLLLQECAAHAENWIEVLDRFEGLGQVPLMTIHKSKGLEFHTMIFFGLDNQTWWSLSPDRGEELNSFFVAFTRAEQRAFFAFCAERGGAIAWLEQLLAPAGVARIQGNALATA